MNLACMGLLATTAAIARAVLHEPATKNWPPPTSAVRAKDAAERLGEAIQHGLVPNQVGIDYAWSTVSSVEPLAEGRNFYPRILGDIKAAESSVHILMFGWKDGTIGRAVHDALIDRLDQGLDVRILVDSFGSRPGSSSKAMFQTLADAGAEIVVNDLIPPHRFGCLPVRRRCSAGYLEIGRADHRKLVVIDGESMWTGGAGFEDHFNDGRFHDVMVRVTGEIVHQAQMVFLTSFVSQGGVLPQDRADLFPSCPPGHIPAAIVQVVPGGFSTAAEAITELIAKSSRRLDIMNPYLTDRSMINAIVNAAIRGSDVRVVVSETSNNSAATAALRHHYRHLLDAGVQIYEFPNSVVHAKLIISDDSVCFGTVNLDAWALHRNFEFAVIVEDANTAQKFVDHIFEPDINQCATAHPTDDAVATFLQSAASRIAYFL